MCVCVCVCVCGHVSACLEEKMLRTCVGVGVSQKREATSEDFSKQKKETGGQKQTSELARGHWGRERRRARSTISGMC